MNNLKSLLFSILAVLAVSVFQSCDPCDGEVPTGCECQEGIVVCPDPCPTGYSTINGSCVSIDGNESIKTGLITSDVTWSADTIHVLEGKVVVSDGVTLTIEAGTIIKGLAGEGSLASALIVARGATINANGTATNPIVMTTILDNIQKGEAMGTNLDEADNGKWGGLIVLGKAPISVDGDAVEARIEGIPASETYGLYGGTSANDNSGSITYISVRHGGALIGEGNEINGITLGGVGNGTVINHIEVVANSDDGVEFFGGTVNASNIVVWAQGDDAYDIDQAYSGTIDNFVYIAGADSDHGMEIDGPEGTADGQFTMTNGTMKGLSAEYADFREGTQASITDVYWFNFNSDFELDDAVTSANYHTNNKLILTGMEFNTTQMVADIFKDTGGSMSDSTSFIMQMDTDNSIVTAASGTVGADTSVFGWTYATLKGALNF